MAEITLIGSGNTATTLGKVLSKAGHPIKQVWSKKQENAKILAELLGSSYTSDISQINIDSDIYLISVKDDAIAEVALQLSLKDKIVAHTSGIRSKHLLEPSSINYGIFYPNVSMTKGVEADLSKVLIMIEGVNQFTIDRLRSLADSITDNAKVVTEQQRRSLHIAAVFANNFTNHFFVIAEEILKQNELSFDNIKPMISAHFTNMMQRSPSSLQTGPALRNDITTINSHLALIADHPHWQELYKMVTHYIQDWNKEKE